MKRHVDYAKAGPDIGKIVRKIEIQFLQGRSFYLIASEGVQFILTSKKLITFLREQVQRFWKFKKKSLKKIHSKGSNGYYKLLLLIHKHVNW